VKYDGVTVALPCGSKSLTASHKAAIDAEYTDAAWRKAKSAGCRGVFFTKSRFGLRCPNRKLKTSAKKRFNRMKRQGEICLKKKGRSKVKLFSNRC
jgi:hypothetical protein